jgi:peptide/nickel transport system substrate-binding protein
MFDKDSSDGNNDSIASAGVDRRKFLATVGAGTAAGLAGCAGGGEETTAAEDRTETESEGTETSMDTTEGEETEETETSGSTKPVLGMATAPNNLSVLKSSTAYTFTIIDNIYTTGTVSNPETNKPVPWAFSDWTLNTDNIGGSAPAITAELRDDLTFSDGEQQTAEDFKFTVEYIKEQGVAGTVAASQFSAVESVEVDSPDGTTVNIFLSEPDRAWLTNILGNYIIPKHIWEGVSDYQKFAPRNEDAVVGAGPWELTDYNWGNWYELSYRGDEANPWNERADWLDSDGPFVDTIRFEVFGSQSALVQNLLDGNIDMTYGTVPVAKAAEAQDQDNLNVQQSPDDGWHHHSYNVRRVPLDDRAFRRLLVKLADKTWAIEDLYSGIGAKVGDYATPPAFSEWRPEPASELWGGEFEGIEIPDLSFPGSTGDATIDQAGIDAAREFLLNADDAKHDYSLGEAQSDTVESPDGQEIYVNGMPFSEAHTNNAGEGGQGPIEFSYNPPSSSPKQAQNASAWTKIARQVGIPVEEKVQSFNSQLPKVYSEENFDMFEMGWTGLTWTNDHFRQFFGSPGADLEGDQSAQLFNAMGYTGADEFIEEQAQLMQPEPRQPLVQKAVARIYSDAPTNIPWYNNVLQPTTTKFTGHIQAVGGLNNIHTFLNIRPA